MHARGEARPIRWVERVLLVVLLLSFSGGVAEAQELPRDRALLHASQAELFPLSSSHAPLSHLRIEHAPQELTMSSADNRGRNDAMLNGALITLGALGIYDNVVVHWILGWHRVIEDSPYNLEIEIGIVAVSTAMLVAGLVRERRARRGVADSQPER